jgi:hypothetical protein
MSDIFISYARPDQTLAQSLAEDLKGRGFKVWWDLSCWDRTISTKSFIQPCPTKLGRVKADQGEGVANTELLRPSRRSDSAAPHRSSL